MTEQNLLTRQVNEGKLIQAPGVYDALTSKIAESIGFPAVYMTGYGSSAVGFGCPDLGLLSLTEMAGNASRITDAVSIPVIADADTGFGNPINVYRTIREYKKAGVAAVHLEDQVWPKRCGFMQGKQTIPVDEMVEKIKAAVDAGAGENLLIIARTDAIATEGFEQAIERGHLYAEAGADMLFVEAPESAEQIESIPKLLPEKPHVINLSPMMPNLAADELQQMGYRIALYPGACLGAQVKACQTVLSHIRETGTQPDFDDAVSSFRALNNLLDVPFFLDLEQKYKSD